MKLYCDGDSWSVSTNNIGEPMGYHLAELMGCEMENYGHSGKSIDKIIRSAQRHVLSNKNTCYMIGIGHTQRFDTSTGEVVDFKYPYLSMQSEKEVETVRINNFVDTDKNFAKQFIKWFEYPFLEYQTLSKLVMLHDFLLFHNVDFIIHNLAWDYNYDLDYEFGKQWIHEVEKRPRIINFFNDSFHSLMRKENFKPFNYDAYKWNGHQTGPGHKFYAEYLFSKWKKINE